jgi:hypothetical protein
MPVRPETVTVTIGSYGPARDIAAERAAYLSGEGPEPMPDTPTAGPVSLGGKKWMWSPVHVHYDDDERPVTAELEVVTGSDGRPRPARVDVRARTDAAIGVDEFRIPIAAVIDAAVAISNFDGPDAEPGALPTGGAFSIGETATTVTVPRRKTARTDDRLRRVADVYRRGEWGARGKAVAATEKVSLNTARNLISEARRRGFLEPPATREDENEED